jgi:uncharacterized protein YdaU (DUF1376 family)
MATHPYIPLYVDDFEAATAHLTPEEDGIYNRLLRLCWRTPGCSLPNDPAWIARKIRLSPADFERLAMPVLGEFFVLVRGRLSQRRLKLEYDNISRKKSARAAAGKKGGAAKALKTHETTPSNATGLPPHTRAFPEPEPNPEPKKEEREGAQVLAFEQAVTSDGGTAAPARGARLKPDWTPSADNLVYASREGFSDAETARMVEAFRDYWTAATGQRATRLDWSATWRTWVRTERDRRPRRSGSAGRVDFV